MQRSKLTQNRLRAVLMFSGSLACVAFSIVVHLTAMYSSTYIIPVYSPPYTPINVEVKYGIWRSCAHAGSQETCVDTKKAISCDAASYLLDRMRIAAVVLSVALGLSMMLGGLDWAVQLRRRGLYLLLLVPAAVAALMIFSLFLVLYTNSDCVQPFDASNTYSPITTISVSPVFAAVTGIGAVAGCVLAMVLRNREVETSEETAALSQSPHGLPYAVLVGECDANVQTGVVVQAAAHEEHARTV